MNRKLAVIGVAALLGSTLAACGHDDNSGSTPPPPPSAPAPPATMMLTTTQTLNTYASKTPETSSPIDVNSAGISFVDTSEITQPVALNGN